MAALLKRVMAGKVAEGHLYWRSPIRALHLPDQSNHHLETTRQLERWADRTLWLLFFKMGVHTIRKANGVVGNVSEWIVANSTDPDLAAAHLHNLVSTPARWLGLSATLEAGTVRRPQHHVLEKDFTSPTQPRCTVYIVNYLFVNPRHLKHHYILYSKQILALHKIPAPAPSSFTTRHRYFFRRDSLHSDGKGGGSGQLNSKIEHVSKDPDIQPPRRARHQTSGDGSLQLIKQALLHH